MLLMIDPATVPDSLADEVRVFILQDGSRHIVGYCIPLDACVGLFAAIPPARVVKVVVNSQLTNAEFVRKYKFAYAPLGVEPQNDCEFRTMLQAPPLPLCQFMSKNRFFVRPTVPLEAQWKMPIEESVSDFVCNKFKLHQNPHLIPYRLPDGLDCYIRLDLANHCQQEYMTHEWVAVPRIPFPLPLQNGEGSTKKNWYGRKKVTSTSS